MQQNSGGIYPGAIAKITDLRKSEFPPVIRGMARINFNDNISYTKNCFGILVCGAKKGFQNFRIVAFAIDGKTGNFTNNSSRLAQHGHFIRV